MSKIDLGRMGGGGGANYDPSNPITSTLHPQRKKETNKQQNK